MSDDAGPLLTPLDLKERPGQPAWALLVVELVQIALTVAYLASGLVIRVSESVAWLAFIAGMVASIVTLVWAVIEVRGRRRRGIPRLVATLAGIELGIYVLLLLFLVWIDAQLQV